MKRPVFWSIGALEISKRAILRAQASEDEVEEEPRAAKVMATIRECSLGGAGYQLAWGTG